MAADDRWRDLLDACADAGEYVRVPALITGGSRPYAVELDLSGLVRFAERAPDRQQVTDQ